MTNYFQAGGVRPRSTFAGVDAIFESNASKLNHNEISEDRFFESVTEDHLLESIEKVANATLRADSAAAVYAWTEGDDSDFDELDAVIFGLAGSGDEEDELTESEADDYNDILKGAAEFLVSKCGATQEEITAMFDGDADASEAVFTKAVNALSDQSEEDLIAEFAVKETLMMEALKKVVRNGEVVMVRTNRRKRRMTAAQKAALKKARRKAHSAAGKAARRKALKIRKSRGLK